MEERPTKVRLPTHGPPTHPGEVLREDFLVPLGLDAAAAAERLAMPVGELEELLAERSSVTPELAARLQAVLGPGAQFWLNLQLCWDLWHEVHR